MNSIVKFSSPNALGPARGYSHLAEVAGSNLIFVSGQVGVDPSNLQASLGDFATQTDQVFANLVTAAKAVGGDFSNIAKLNIYIVDSVPRSELAPLLAAITHHTGSGSPPVNTLLFVSGLVRPELLIEIEAVIAVSS